MTVLNNSERVDLEMKHTSGTVNIMPEIACLNLMLTHYNRNELTQIYKDKINNTKGTLFIKVY